MTTELDNNNKNCSKELIYNSDDYYDLPTIRYFVPKPERWDLWPFTLYAIVFANSALYYQKCDKQKRKTGGPIRIGVLDQYNMKDFYKKVDEVTRVEIEDRFGAIGEF